MQLPRLFRVEVYAIRRYKENWQFKHNTDDQYFTELKEAIAWVKEMAMGRYNAPPDWSLEFLPVKVRTIQPTVGPFEDHFEMLCDDSDKYVIHPEWYRQSYVYHDNKYCSKEKWGWEDDDGNSEKSN